MQPIAMTYEEIRPVSLREVMMLKAMGEPMMMRESKAVKVRVTVTALRGMSQPGRT
jgi:hypothetical protein